MFKGIDIDYILGDALVQKRFVVFRWLRFNHVRPLNPVTTEIQVKVINCRCQSKFDARRVISPVTEAPIPSYKKITPGVRVSNMTKSTAATHQYQNTMFSRNCIIA